MTTPQEVVVIVRDVFTSFTPTCGTSMPVKVDELRPIIEAKSGIPITLSALKWQARQLKGRLLRYADHAEIEVSHSLNLCWTRFVACKEMAHLLLDRDQSQYTQNPGALIDRLIQDPWANDKDITSERAAVLAAMELLMPWCCRGQMEAMVKSGASHLQIATHFMVPERMVDRRLDPKMIDRLERAHEGLD